MNRCQRAHTANCDPSGAACREHTSSSLSLSSHPTLLKHSATTSCFGANICFPIKLAAAAAKLLQSCPTPCDPIDGSPTRLRHPWDSPGKNTGVGCHFLLQCMKVKSEREVAQSCPTFATPWTAAYQAPLSKGFPRQEYWSGLPLPSPPIKLRYWFYKR